MRTAPFMRTAAYITSAKGSLRDTLAETSLTCRSAERPLRRLARLKFSGRSAVLDIVTTNAGAHAGSPLASQGREHPRTMGWLGTSALAMGGSNQSLFLIGALVAGQGTILGQGTAAVPILAFGLLLSWMALPGWTELILMWPNRVGGIAATCGEAFRPYAPVLGNLTGVS